MKIILASTSELKKAAVVQACKDIELNAQFVATVGVPSGQNEQPIGVEETFRGAFARAQSAMNTYRDPNGSAYIGIENGLLQVDKETFIDFAVVVVLSGERRIITISGGLEFPFDCVKEASRRGFEKTTAGSVIAEKLGGDKADPHWKLTREGVSRKDTLAQAIALALSQL